MEAKRVILVIDDEVDLRETIEYQFKNKGFEVWTARDGVEGLEILKKVVPNLIILDINMPKMGGIEFFRNICDSKGIARYPVLVLTARANVEQVFKGFDIAGFLTKPFSLAKLLEEVENILKKKDKKPGVNDRL